MSFPHECFPICLKIGKGCISVCVENMQKALSDLSPLEIVEMFATIFCLLKDSSDATATLLDDFRTCHGYTFITDLLLRFFFLNLRFYF